MKIKNIGDKILKKTIKELDKYILNEFKKLDFGKLKNLIF